jgi:hypothetical protein
MDPFGGMGRDELRVFCWAAAAAFLLVVGVCRPRRLHWTALGSVLLFAAFNVGAGIYILNDFSDSRWSSGGEPSLTVPPLSGTPVVGQLLGPLDAVLEKVVGGVNTFLAFQQALLVALEFLAASGLALLVSFPVAVIAFVVNYFIARRRKADFKKYRATVDLLKEELEQLKQQISSGNFVDTALPAVDEGPVIRGPLSPRGDSGMLQ